MRTLVAGLVRTTFGVHGALKIESVSGELEHLLTLDTVVLRMPESIPGRLAAGTLSDSGAGAGGHNRAQETEFRVEEARPHSDLVVMKLAGIDSIEAATRLRGAELLVPRESAASRGDNEFYIADLVGCRVISNGTDIGAIVSVWDNGPDDMLEISTERGIRNIPFRSEFVGTVDIEGEFIELIAEWMLE